MTPLTMDTHKLSPTERLAASRQALVRHMRHEDPEDVQEGGSSNEIDASASTWGLAKQAATAWWQNHPARLAADLGRPLIQNLAEEQPLKLLGISAGLGAAAIILRPWRLISLTGLLLAALKSSEVAGFANSLLAPRPEKNRFR